MIKTLLLLDRLTALQESGLYEVFADNMQHHYNESRE